MPCTKQMTEGYVARVGQPFAGADAARRWAATLAVCFLIGLLIRANWVAFQHNGFAEGVWLVVSASVFFVGLVARSCRRYLPVPPTGIVAAAAILIALTWACPTTTRTRFFAATSRVRLGMSVNEVRALLPQYPSHAFSPLATFPLNAEKAASVGARPRFNGSLLYKHPDAASDFTNFGVNNGTVTNIYSYVGM